MTDSSRIVSVLAPPENPTEIPTAQDWQDCEEEFGQLPIDYKKFIGLYGSGVIENFIYIFNPVSMNEFTNFSIQAKNITSSLKYTADLYPELYHMHIFPENNGFLPWGITDNGDSLYWDTTGEPEDWTIVVMDPRSPVCIEFPSGLIDFLVALIEGTFRCPVFPNGLFLSGNASFLAL